MTVPQGFVNESDVRIRVAENIVTEKHRVCEHDSPEDGNNPGDNERDRHGVFPAAAALGKRRAIGLPAGIGGKLRY